jgi:iron complex outermembrane recepter protein
MKIWQRAFKLASTLFLSVGLAAAQTPQTTPTPPEAQAPETGGIPVARPPGGEPAPGTKPMEEEILVTGSRLRRKDLTTPAPVTVLTREQWQESGRVTIGDFLQLLPEQGNAPNFQLNNGGSTYSADGSTRISLRSLGVTRTLVLVNGRRMVNAGLGASSAVDLNSIPTATVERIEILKDGASAVYGSDAIAGVVNIITRKRFNGTELSGEYGISTRGDAETIDVQGVMGRTGDWGNFLVAGGYFTQGESWLRDRDFSKFAYTFDYTAHEQQPGGSSRTPQGVVQFRSISRGPGQPPDPDTFCTAGTLCRRIVDAYPANWFRRFVRDPSAPFGLGWRPFVGDDRYNFAAENYLTIPSERIQAYASADTKVGIARPYFEAFWVQRHTQQNAAPMPLNPGDYNFPGTNRALFVSKDSIYNPFGVDLTFAGRRLVEFGRRYYIQDLNTFKIVTGVDGTLPEAAGPFKGWFWDGSVNFGRTSGTFTTQGAIRNSRISDSVGPSFRDADGTPRCGTPAAPIAGCVPLNLFGGPNNGSIDPNQIASLGFVGTSRALDQLFTVDGNVGGELVRILADRPTAIVVGYEYRRQLGAQVADPIVASGDSADFNFTSTSGRFSANEAYAELSIPIISGAPFIENLEASAAARYVNYSSFGSKFTYKFGARYTPIPDFTLRGTYSTAFRAPTISELFLGNAETAPTVRDPCADLTTASPALASQCTSHGVPSAGSGDTGNQELAHVGGNKNLKAETAKIFTAGIVVEPQFLRGLSITVDYYHITVDDPVGTIGLATILKECFPASVPGNVGTSFEPYCDRIHRNTDGQIQSIDDFNTNLSQIRTAGVDFALRYFLPTEIGRFGYAFDGTWLNFFNRDQPNAPTIHGAGNYDLGALPNVKFNTGVTYYYSGFNAAVLGRFIGSFRECGAFDSSGDYLSPGGLCWVDPNAPHHDVGARFYVDANVGYNFMTPIGSTYVSAGMNNIFDKQPRFVYAAPLANSDPSVYDFVGRFVYFRVLQRF